MSNVTPNLGLQKPLENEYYDINVQNSNMDKIDAAVGNIKVPDASLTQKGIVQLSSTTTSTSETMAATPKAVKAAYDEAMAAKQAGNDRKAEVVAALVAKGIAASTSDTWAQLISKMTAIIVASGDAMAADLLSGKTATNKNGSFIGTMPHLTGNRNATGVAKWPDGGLAVYPEKGYQKGGAGDGEIKASVAQLQSINPYLQPQYIVQGADIFGVNGTAKKALDYSFLLYEKGVGREFIDRGNIERGYGNTNSYSYSKGESGVYIQALGSNGTKSDSIGFTTGVSVDITNVKYIKFTCWLDIAQDYAVLELGISKTKHTQNAYSFDSKVSYTFSVGYSRHTESFILDVTSATGMFYIGCVLYARETLKTTCTEIELLTSL